MYEWVITYKDEDSFDELMKTGEMVFVSGIINLVIIKSYLSSDAIMKIKGVIECSEARKGYILN